MLGLLLASIMSVFNVFNDVARKKVLDHQFDAGLVSFWSKVLSFLAFGLSIALLVAIRGVHPELPDIGKTLSVSPACAFFLYLLLNALIEGTAILLNLRALQVSPISYCVPFMAFTPLFLLPAGKFVLHEPISSGMVIGVSLVVVGALVVNRQLFSKGMFEPVRAIIRERGSRYMLIVAFLLTITNILDKWFVTSGGTSIPFDVSISRALTLALGKSVMLALFFCGLTVMRIGKWNGGGKESSGMRGMLAGIDWTSVMRKVPVWMLLTGILESLVLLLQLTAMQFTVAALVISIKRSGMVLAVALGWFIFKERGITDRVIASFVMITGVLIFFLTKPDAQGGSILALQGAIGLAMLVLAGMGVALYITRNHHKKTA